MILVGVDEGGSPVGLLELMRAELHVEVITDLSRQVDERGRKRAALVNAWKTVALEQSTEVRRILLKRRGDSNKPVFIPRTIDVASFSPPSEETKLKRLGAVVCRLGNSTEVGHYITYLFDKQGQWKRWDDLEGSYLLLHE